MIQGAKVVQGQDLIRDQDPGHLRDQIQDLGQSQIPDQDLNRALMNVVDVLTMIEKPKIAHDLCQILAQGQSLVGAETAQRRKMNAREEDQRQNLVHEAKLK